MKAGKKSFKALVLLLLMFVLAATLVGCSSSNNNNQQTDPPPVEDPAPPVEDPVTPPPSNPTPTPPPPAPAAPAELTLGSTAKFDRLEITLDSSYTTTKNAAGETVIVVGATIKNEAPDKNWLRMNYLSYYNPAGVVLPDLSDEFPDNVAHAGEIEPGQSVKANFHILYGNNGNYFITLSIAWGDRAEFKVPVSL